MDRNDYIVVIWRAILGLMYLAIICNSTVIEIYCDKIQVSQRIKGCQILQDRAKYSSDFFLFLKSERILRFSRLMKNLIDVELI